jgi:hypothetical protein
MIRFNLDEILTNMPTFYGELERKKRFSPPGKWRPFFKLSYVTFQDEETDKWVGWVKWVLFDHHGQYPCRDTGKNESISRTDPPDYWPTEAAAGQFAGACVVALREQYNEWIKQDFASKERERG